MTIPGIRMIWKGVGRFNRWFAQRAIILVYHQVAEVDRDPWALSVTPRHFSEHLEILQRHFRPLALQQLVQALEDGHIPKRSVAITFDDGYANNLHCAKPLLERYGVPATIFVTTGVLGQEREFWWDELEKLLLQSGRLPEELQLTVDGNTYSWKLDETTDYGKDDAYEHRSWRAWEEAPRSRHKLYRSLRNVLQSVSASEQKKVLDRLQKWIGCEPTCRSTHRVLDVSEVTALARGGLIDIGAHTVTHPVLSTLSLAAQRVEIQQSKAFLEDTLGFPVSSFSYPYGSRSDYTLETAALVREAGFTSACAYYSGVVKLSTERFQLPRMQVYDWDGEDFGGALERQYSN